VSQARLLEFESRLREASRLLRDAEVVVSAMLITGDYSHLKDVEALVKRALERIQESQRIGRELVEEVDRAIPWELEEGEEP
jgi:hypothetical protein